MNIQSTAPVGDAGLTENQRKIAENLGWTENLALSPFRELTKYIDSLFSNLTSKNAVACHLPEVLNPADEGNPFYAMTNQYSLAVVREYVGDQAVYSSDYSMLQASEAYQETLESFILHLTRGREAAVFCKVTDMPVNFDVSKTNIMTCCSVDCDIFLPTGMSKGMSSRNGAHITDKEVFASLVTDYIKVMRQIQRTGYELCAHFYLTRICDIERIKENKDVAQEIWAARQFRDYRKVTITDEGEVILQLRQDQEK